MSSFRGKLNDICIPSLFLSLCKLRVHRDSTGVFDVTFTDRAKEVPLLPFFVRPIVSYLAFFLSLFVPHRSLLFLHFLSVCPFAFRSFVLKSTK